MPILVASEVMDLSAAALNDIDKTTYDYDTQLPYLKMALQELQELFELNALPVTEQSSGNIPITARTSEIEFNASGALRLPDNMIEIQNIWEWMGTYWNPVARGNWVWKNNKLTFFTAYTNTEIKIDYIGSLFPKYLRADTILPVQNSIGYLAYKTAELIADMIEHNDSRAQTNGGRAMASLDRITGITVKAKQNIMARRRPFRAGYRRHGALG